MLTLSLGIAAVVVGIIIILSIFLIRGLRRNFILHMFAKFSKNKTENSQNMEAFIKNFGSLAPKRYNYSDVKKMTESFSNKLGQGGYGDVYKGKLPDNRLVAVKFLKESKGNGEEFINELEPGNDFELHGAIIEEEKELAKKMVLVSLWCIQTIPSDRPSITRVVEMLEGGLECLQVPPKPSLASQTRSPQHFSAIASSSSTA
ncbi:hypothetical protein LWI28_018574 [Acer negundo]|uniref:Uncharacterized protein n=1 Tax=Acer negundo TaxID=4023 RepID=A0AAD5IF36_ACENE|nr:hypothetical protein LWI28_018574 [Acer negundo]